MFFPEPINIEWLVGSGSYFKGLVLIYLGHN